MPLSVSKAIHLALCSWPRTSPCHFSFGPWPYPGRSQEVYTVESRNQKSRSGQLSSEWQLLGPLVGPFPSAQPSLGSAPPLALDPGPLGATVSTAMVLKQAYLGSARSLLFLGGSLPSGSAPHWGAPEMPLPSVPLISLPLPPSRATASGTNSSNTARIVRVPHPPDLPLCLPSCCFF